MASPEITSPQNRKVVEAAKLVRGEVRQAEGKIILEGPILLDEALATYHIPETVFVLAGADGDRAADAGSTVLVVSDRVMAKLATTRHPRGPVAVMEMPDTATPPSGAAVVLWGVTDPGNVGTAIRSAVAFGVVVVAGPGCADLWNPKVLRAAAGAHFRGRVVAASDPQSFDRPTLLLLRTALLEERWADAVLIWMEDPRRRLPG